MNVEVVTKPTLEPVLLSDVKDHLRQDLTDEDSLILSLITAARQWAESFTRQTFVTTTLKIHLDDFPRHGAREIELPRGPIQSVSSIKYTDDDGTEQTLSTSIYTVDTVARRIYESYDEEWPSDVRDIPKAVNVTYLAGYDDGSSPKDSRASVPQAIKQAILMLVAHFYHNRSSITATQLHHTPHAVEALLWPYRDLRWL